MVLFGQDIFLKAEATKGLADPEYRKARATSLRLAGSDGIERLLTANHLAAVAGTPHLTVPMGAVLGLPVGLSFLGPAWSEARLLGLGYAYEQAAHAAVTPGFVASVLARPEVARRLRPAPRR